MFPFDDVIMLGITTSFEGACKWRLHCMPAGIILRFYGLGVIIDWDKTKKLICTYKFATWTVRWLELRPIYWSTAHFDIFFYVGLKKLLNKWFICRCFKTPWRSYYVSLMQNNDAICHDMRPVVWDHRQQDCLFNRLLRLMQRSHQSFVSEILWWTVDSHYKEPVTRQVFIS